MIKRTQLSTISSSLLLVPLFFAGQACDEGASVREIGPSRPETAPGTGSSGQTTTAERLGFRARPDTPRSPQGEPKPVYQLPAGWTVLPSSQWVTVKMQVAGHADATCHLSILGGEGGGLLANVNRWHNQIGLPPTSAAEVSQLPTHKFFNSKAIFLDLTGSYAGMGGSEKENWGLMGLLLVLDQASLFLKMQGPADLLKKEKQHFLNLAASFKWVRGGGQAHAEHGSTAGGSSAGQSSGVGSKGGLRFDTPGTWKSKPGSQFRLINFDVGSGGRTECYVSQSGGGLLPNLNRWRGQMGHKRMNTAELSKLPSLRVLGVETPLLEIEGPFQGMTGPRIDKAAMLATYVETMGTSYAVKLTGPIAEVRAAKKDFVNFVQSLRSR